jgi:hypothetical protein
MIYGWARVISGTPVFVMLDDDMRLCHRFVHHMLRIWDQAVRNGGVTMHLMVDSSRKDKACWTGEVPQVVNDELRRIQWVDGSYVCDHRMLGALEWVVEPIPKSRWKGSPSLSTGVGQQLSQRLVRKGYLLLQVTRSLVVHTGLVSQYNPNERTDNPLSTVDFIDGKRRQRALEIEAREECSSSASLKPVLSSSRGRKDRGSIKPERSVKRNPVQLRRVLEERISVDPPKARCRGPGGGLIYVSLASIPSRQGILHKVIDSLINQVDIVQVYLNGYPRIPQCLGHDRIAVALSQTHGDRGDAGKVFWCDKIRGYHLLCDDDLEYPGDYASQLINRIERYRRKAIVGVHGVTFPESGKIVSYYKSRKVSHFARPQRRDNPVHLLGTGCLAYHTDTIKLKPEDFEIPNMADIWMGLACQRQQVPVVCIARVGDWLKSLPTGPTIHGDFVGNDQVQTKVMQRVWPWKINKVQR